jgi:hypothetical protein
MCILYRGGRATLEVRGRFQPLTLETQRVRGYLPPVDVDVRPIRVRIGTHIIEEGGPVLLEHTEGSEEVPLEIRKQCLLSRNYAASG